MSTRTTREYCVQHGHQDFINTDNGLVCPVCDPELAAEEAKRNQPRTWRAMAREATDVQNACNLSGVVHSYSRIITEVRARLELEGNLSTEVVNHHPVCILFADKIADLTGIQQLGSDSVANAYRWAQLQLKD